MLGLNELILIHPFLFIQTTIFPEYLLYVKHRPDVLNFGGPGIVPAWSDEDLSL